MKTRVLGTMTVSAIGLGGMPMSIEGRPERSRSIATIHAALDAGITLIDTADVVRVGGVDQGDPRVQGSVDRRDRATSLRTALDRHGHPTQPDRRYRHRPKNTSLHVNNLLTSGERKSLTPPRKTIVLWPLPWWCRLTLMLSPSTDRFGRSVTVVATTGLIGAGLLP